MATLTVILNVRTHRTANYDICYVMIIKEIHSLLNMLNVNTQKAEAEAAASEEATEEAAEEAEVAAPAKKGTKHLEPVFEEIEFEEAFDLTDDESWVRKKFFKLQNFTIYE